jgi:hypothetical protein
VQRDERESKACTSANRALTCSGVAVDRATCTVSHACSRLGDQTNGTYGCGSIFNPPGAPDGSFSQRWSDLRPFLPRCPDPARPTTPADQAQLTERPARSPSRSTPSVSPSTA